MPSVPVTDSEKLVPGGLSDEALLAIGRLIRAFADLEEYLNYFIELLLEISPTDATVVLSRVAISRKLEMARMLSTKQSEEDSRVFKGIFEHDMFKEIYKCRNAVAHGTLLGLHRNGDYAFLTDRSDSQENTLLRYVYSISTESITSYATIAQQSFEKLVRANRLESWLKRYSQPTVGPHPRARQTRTPG